MDRDQLRPSQSSCRHGGPAPKCAAAARGRRRRRYGGESEPCRGAQAARARGHAGSGPRRAGAQLHRSRLRELRQQTDRSWRQPHALRPQPSHQPGWYEPGREQPHQGVHRRFRSPKCQLPGRERFGDVLLRLQPPRRRFPWHERDGGPAGLRPSRLHHHLAERQEGCNLCHRRDLLQRRLRQYGDRSAQLRQLWHTLPDQRHLRPGAMRLRLVV